MAYWMGRTLILESKPWQYNNGGWEEIFMPMSDTCTSLEGNSYGRWELDMKDPGAVEDVQVLKLEYGTFLTFKPEVLPPVIPLDILKRLEVVHGEPHIWWVGQLMKYILRLQPYMQDKINRVKLPKGKGLNCCRCSYPSDG
jgi:glycoprotein 6-alpha-L-fucosyltransferase